MNIRLYRYSRKTIYSKAGRKLTQVLSRSSTEGKKTLLLLSGGTSVNVYTYLSSVSKLLVIAQVDERFRPENKEDINARAIEKAGLRVPYYKVRQDGSLIEATHSYDIEISTLMEQADYKVAVLGIGEDCHTAGLIPGYENDWNINQYVSGYNLKQGKFRQRITVTPKLLEKLDYALVVAVGEKKKEAIKNALKKENLEDLNKYPAAIIQKIKEVDLFRVDLDL